MTDEQIYEWVKEHFGKITKMEMRYILKGVCSPKKLQDIRQKVAAERKAAEPTDADILKYVTKHWKKMNDKQMAQKLGVRAYRVRDIRIGAGLIHIGGLRASSHICWRCANSTSMYRCIFVASCLDDQKPKYYDGTIVKNGRISHCPNFEED